jgi:protein-tyrosine phosphatase
MPPVAPHERAFEKILTANPDDADAAAAAGARYMTQEYEHYPVLPGTQLAVRQGISLLASSRGVIVHCFAGKDRTGLTVAMILEAVGVQRDAILSDFLPSNAAAGDLRERMLESMRNRAETPKTAEIETFVHARLNDEVLGVREEYLAAAWHTIDTQYGSLSDYLETVGVIHEQVDQLRSALRKDRLPSEPGW